MGLLLKLVRFRIGIRKFYSFDLIICGMIPWLDCLGVSLLDIEYIGCGRLVDSFLMGNNESQPFVFGHHNWRILFLFEKFLQSFVEMIVLPDMMKLNSLYCP